MRDPGAAGKEQVPWQLEWRAGTTTAPGPTMVREIVEGAAEASAAGEPTQAAPSTTANRTIRRISNLPTKLAHGHPPRREQCACLSVGRAVAWARALAQR